MAKSITIVQGLHEKLERAINKSPLNLSQICERAKISRHMLWQYRYDMITPSALVLARLAVVLNISTDYLLGISTKESINE
jgi:transcriptional regulator with XRE-family HTH domain